MNCTQSESADCHAVADKTEYLWRYQRGIRKVADGEAVCAEVQILCRTKQRIAVFIQTMQADFRKAASAVPVSTPAISKLASSTID